ncbi:MAG: hypothetical protein LLG06_19710 [Desulfobacteraceae bacterium]|nr:hypothetical protein [Desulfobacteraceae bacterium]
MTIIPAELFLAPYRLLHKKGILTDVEFSQIEAIIVPGSEMSEVARNLLEFINVIATQGGKDAQQANDNG